MAQAHHRVWLERLNVRFIRRHLTKTIKRDERGFYYSNADSPPTRFYFKTWREAASDLAIERLVSPTRKGPPCRDL